MRRHSRIRTIVASAEHETSYRPSFSAALLALALAICLMWHGMARADDFAYSDDDSSQAYSDDDGSQPAPSQSAPDSSGCTDSMDFSPEDNLPDPFDADTVAFHAPRQSRIRAEPAGLDENCSGPDEQPISI